MADDSIWPLDKKRKCHRRTGLYPNAVCYRCDKNRCEGRKRTCEECKRTLRLANARKTYRAAPSEYREKAQREYFAAMAKPDIVEKKRRQARESYRRHAETRKAQAQAYRERKRAEDAEAFRAYQRVCSIKSRTNDPQETKRKVREYWRQKRDGNLKARVNARISERLRLALKSRRLTKDRCGWQKLVGYTVSELTDRLLATMPKGHSWDDFLSGALHIDHILPIASFEFSSVDDPSFKACWALNNLQLLPALENLKKSDRLDWQSAA